MTKAIEIIKLLDEEYPKELRAVWDSTDGYLQGDTNKEVLRVGVGLEINPSFVDKKFDMIILHHPPKFGKEMNITNPFYTKIHKDTIIYALHSRIDVSGNINKSLASFLFERYNIDKALDDGTIIISLPNPVNLSELIPMIKSKLRKNKIKVIKKEEVITKIAIHGGEGFNQHHVEKAIKENIDLYLAGDLTHHLAESAYFHNATFIDIDHVSEQVGMKDLCKELQTKFPKCDFEYLNSEPYWELQ